MTMYGKDNRQQFYMVYTLSLAIFVASVIFLPHAFALAGAALLVAAVAVLHSGDAIRGMLIKNSIIEVVSGNYKISPNLLSISRQEGESFKSMSIAMLTARQGQGINGKPLKELMDSISERFEFSIELAAADKTKILDNLRTKMRIKEIHLSRLAGRSADKAAALSRQIDLINGDITALSSSGSSFEFVMLVKSIAVSGNRIEAESASARGIEVLAAKFSAALGVDYEVLSGERLLCYSGV